jgi:hypothetical protein
MAGAVGPPQPVVKQRAAALSIISNSSLILLKLPAGTVTGSVAILTEAGGERLRGADVLIHLEPEDRVRPGDELASVD